MHYRYVVDEELLDMIENLEMINLKRKFHQFGYKYTQQRQIVMDTLLEHPDLHLSSGDIFKYLEKKKINIGQSTIYRTLIMMEKMKLIRSADLDDGYTRYELYNYEEEHAHHHLICSKCGSITDITDDLLKDLETQIFQNYHFKVNDHCLKFFGKCENCKKDKK